MKTHSVEEKQKQPGLYSKHCSKRYKFTGARHVKLTDECGSMREESVMNVWADGGGVRVCFICILHPY